MCLFFTNPGARYTRNDRYFAPDSLTILTNPALQSCPLPGRFAAFKAASN
jgi:hypothetical protein